MTPSTVARSAVTRAVARSAGTRAVARTAALAADLARDLARLVVPVACAGCSRFDVRLCDECSAPWWEAPFRAEEGAARLDVLGRAPLPTWAVAELDGSVHRAIAAWKDGGRRDLDAFFGAAARRAATAVTRELGDPRGVGPPQSRLPAPPSGTKPLLAKAPRVVLPPLAVVPVPSARSSVRRRGADLTALLARETARGLREAGLEVTLDRALAAAGQRSRGRSSSARWDAARVRLRLQPRARCVVLVDDVMTTGATLARASACLEDAGTAVIGALVLAATPRRGASSGRALG